MTGSKIFSAQPCQKPDIPNYFNRLLGQLKDTPQSVVIADSLSELLTSYPDDMSLFGEPFSPQQPDRVVRRIKSGFGDLGLLLDQTEMPEADFHRIRRNARRLAQAHILSLAATETAVSREAILLRQISKQMGREHGAAVIGFGSHVVQPSEDLKDLITQLV